MKSLIYIWLIVSCSLWSSTLLAQREDKVTFNEGVDAYRDGNYEDALTQFESAYEKNKQNARALYNAGNAAYLKGDFERANQYYSDYAQAATSPAEIGKAYFNQGNTFLQQADAMGMDPSKLQDAQKLYKEAVKSFKSSLKNNPNDMDAKYNLTYALDKIQKNQEQQDQKQDNQDQNNENQENQENQDNNDQNENSENENNQGDNQDQNDSQGDQNEDQENKGDKEDQENQEDQNGEGDENEKKDDQEQDGQENQGDQEEQEKQAQISKAQAEQDLDAINEEEGEILKKVYGSRGDKNKKVSSGKDW